MRTLQRSKWGRDALSEVSERSGGPSKVPRGVGRPSRRTGRPTQRSRRCRESLSEVWEGLGGPPGPSRGLGGS